MWSIDDIGKPTVAAILLNRHCLAPGHDDIMQAATILRGESDAGVDYYGWVYTGRNESGKVIFKSDRGNDVRKI